MINLSSCLRLFRFLLLFPLLWSERFCNRESVDFLHLLCQCTVNHSVPLKQSFAFKLFCHNDNREFCTTSEKKNKSNVRKEILEEWNNNSMHKNLPPRHINNFLQKKKKKEGSQKKLLGTFTMQTQWKK